jgi:hypothetical protein
LTKKLPQTNSLVSDNEEETPNANRKMGNSKTSIQSNRILQSAFFIQLFAFRILQVP